MLYIDVEDAPAVVIIWDIYLKSRSTLRERGSNFSELKLETANLSIRS